MNGCYNGPRGECSEQMYKLYQLLKAKGITLYNGFLPKGSFFFEMGNDRYTVWDEPDGKGLHMVWTKRYERDHRSPYQLVEVATARAVLD